MARHSPVGAFALDKNYYTSKTKFANQHNVASNACMPSYFRFTHFGNCVQDELTHTA